MEAMVMKWISSILFSTKRRNFRKELTQGISNLSLLRERWIGSNGYGYGTFSQIFKSRILAYYNLHKI